MKTRLPFIVTALLCAILVGCQENGGLNQTIESGSVNTPESIDALDRDGLNGDLTQLSEQSVDLIESLPETLVSKNEWYTLWEKQITDKRSLFRTDFHKLDAQLGISIAVEIAKVADKRAFRSFRVTNTKNCDVQVVDFLQTPADLADAIFDVSMMLQLEED